MPVTFPCQRRRLDCSWSFRMNPRTAAVLAKCIWKNSLFVNKSNMIWSVLQCWWEVFCYQHIFWYKEHCKQRKPVKVRGAGLGMKGLWFDVQIDKTELARKLKDLHFSATTVQVLRVPWARHLTPICSCSYTQQSTDQMLWVTVNVEHKLTQWNTKWCEKLKKLLSVSTVHCNTSQNAIRKLDSYCKEHFWIFQK